MCSSRPICVKASSALDRFQLVDSMTDFVCPLGLVCDLGRRRVRWISWAYRFSGPPVRSVAQFAHSQMCYSSCTRVHWKIETRLQDNRVTPMSRLLTAKAQLQHSSEFANDKDPAMTCETPMTKGDFCVLRRTMHAVLNLTESYVKVSHSNH